MLLSLCHLQVEAAAFFGNGPNKVDRPNEDPDGASCQTSLNMSYFMKIKEFLGHKFIPRYASKSKVDP